MTQPFPQLGTPLTDPRTGNVTPVWRGFFATLWNNQGGAQTVRSAPVSGNANQTFSVATATAGTHAVPLTQADGRYAPIAGSQTQPFYVGNAPAGSNQALRRSQADGLFVAFGVAGGAIAAVTVGASPYTYTATTGGTLAVSGGTVTGITLTRSGTSVPVAIGNIPVRNGDAVAITYTAAPTVNFIPT